MRNALTLLSGIPIVAIAAITTGDILMRAITGQAFIAAYEIVSTLLPFVVFLALPFITAENSHISVNVIDNVLPQEHVWILEVFKNVIGMVLLWVLASAAWKLGIRAVDWNTTTTLLRIPLGYVILFIASSLKITSVVYAYQTAVILIQQFKKVKS